ncbi:hypothetical protein [Nostoc sp. C110]|uniref:hypothetical protein n=1 Tax=Nostoc sp. C110 TaxID=3349876 RepID=UPI00370D7755
MTYQGQDNANHPNGHSNIQKMAENVHVVMGAAHATHKISEGIDEGDLGKVGEGLATGGIVGITTASVAGPAFGSFVAGVAGTAAGTAVATAFLPVSIVAVGVGAALWGWKKLTD